MSNYPQDLPIDEIDPLHEEGCGCCEINAEDDSISWGELAELTHETQVARFNWCACEDNEGNENPYADCPRPELATHTRWYRIPFFKWDITIEIDKPFWKRKRG